MAKDRIIIPGIPTDAARVIIAEIAALKDELALLQRKGGRAGIVTTDTAAKPGELLNIEGPSGETITIVLPQATQALRNARVTLSFRNSNPVRVVCVLGTVNGEAFVLNDRPGTYDAICDGLGGWAVQVGVSEAGSGAGGGGGSVSTDLAGLSVLGRAGNTLGAMAAITSTAARQVLRNDDAGTSLEWEFPIEAQANGVDQGNVHTVNREDGRLTVATGVATFEAPSTVVDTQSGTLNAYALPATLQHGDTLAIVCSADVTLNGIVAKPAGFGFYLNVSGAAARILTINDESGSATALNRLSLPADLASRNPPGASFWVSYASTRWLVVERAITEIQDGGSSQGFARTINAADTTSITGTATISAGTASLSYTRAALTGFAAASANSNATTSAEPIVTYSASSNMSAERVTTSSTSVTVSTSVANQIEFQRAALTGDVTASANSNTMAIAADVIVNADINSAAAIALSKLATQAAGTFVGVQVDGATGAPVALTGAEAAESLRYATTQSVTLAATTNDQTLNADTVRLLVSLTGSQTLTGMTGGVAGRRVYIENVDATDTLTLASLDTGSAVANRFRTPTAAPFTLSFRESVEAQHNGTDWRILSRSFRAANLAPITGTGTAISFSHTVAFSALGAAGTDRDVTLTSSSTIAFRILSAELRVITPVALGVAALRDGAAGAGAVLMPDAAVATQTFSTAVAGRHSDNADSTAAVAIAGGVYLRLDQSVDGEITLYCVPT